MERFMAARNAISELVSIRVDKVFIEGMLELPKDAMGMVLFAHGSGSSRLSARNNYVASQLSLSGIGTLLIDLLTQEEDQDYAARFDINLLTHRLLGAANWIFHQESLADLPLGLFGASTGAAAALEVAALSKADLAGSIRAVVSRGGRPDLASQYALATLTAPTLLIVGGNDDVVIDMNQKALAFMHCQKKLVIVPGATHLFEEVGALERVSELATEWFLRCFESHWEALKTLL
jgi:putative phosphoribosyl transferase